MKIEKYKFGVIEINGRVYNQDIKIVGEQIFSNWWRKEGHFLYKEDIEDILKFSPDCLVIGTGAYGAMTVDENLESYLRQNNIQYYIGNTANAIKKFNQLVKEGKKVAGCFHLTC